MVEDRVREDILYREALALGLDKDDTIVKRRMAQKMQFLAEDVAAAQEPTTDELRSWFAEHTRPVRGAGAGQLPAPLFLARQARRAAPGRRGEGADRARRPAAGLAARRRRSPIPSCSRTTMATARRRRSPASSDPNSRRPWRSSRPAPGRGRSNPATAGIWSLSTRAIAGRVPAFEEVEQDVKTAWLGDAEGRGLARRPMTRCGPNTRSSCRCRPRRRRRGAAGTPLRRTRPRRTTERRFERVAASAACWLLAGLSAGLARRRSRRPRPTNRGRPIWKSRRPRPATTPCGGARRCWPACACRSCCVFPKASAMCRSRSSST